MTPPRHTPLPWCAFIKGSTIQIDIGPKPTGKRPCVIEWGGFDSSDLPLEEQKANARLIAAAPALLSALEEHLPILERAEADPETWMRLTAGTGIATLNRLRAAIAQAQPV